MKLLREYYELCDGGICEDLLTEDEKRRVREEGTVILSGVMQCAEKRNANGRVYPKKILEREVKAYAKACKERRALGELAHPESSVVNLQNCSHVVTEIWMDGDEVKGKIEILETPAGQILKSLIKADIPCGISSRGLGSVKEEKGNTIVEDDFQLICFDMVSDPSTPGAFMMKEARDLTEANIKASKSNRISSLIDDILKRDRSE